MSVIIPLYNHEKYVAEALRSVLDQVDVKDEVLVVDDGSTDSGPAIVETFSQARLIRRPHTGIFPTMNAGLSMATGDLIAFLDSDDRWLPGKTNRQWEELMLNPSVDVVFGKARRFRMVNSGGEQTEEPLDVLGGQSAQGGLFHKRAFDRVGHFSEDDRVHGFLDWMARAQVAGLTIRQIPEVVFERRIHGENYSVLQAARQRATYLATLKSKLDRQRNPGATS